MPQLNQDQLKTKYINWLNERILIDDLNGVFQITSPFLDTNNDRLQIYVVPEGNKLKLSDDGYIITELEMSGCDIFNSKHRVKVLTFILNKFGVKRNNDELFLYSTLDDYAQKKHFLLQAMLSVNDMFMTSRTHVTNIFLEEVEKYLIKSDIRFSDDISFVGKSGFTHSFDFLISKYRDNPDRIIKAINNPTRSTAESLLFSWNETREIRKSKAALYAFLNDSDKSISNDVMNAFIQYDIIPVRWSKKNNFIDELSA